MNNHIYSTLFKTQERESDRRSKEIEQRKESQTHTHKQDNKHMHVYLRNEQHCYYDCVWVNTAGVYMGCMNTL